MELKMRSANETVKDLQPSLFSYSCEFKVVRGAKKHGEYKHHGICKVQINLGYVVYEIGKLGDRDYPIIDTYHYGTAMEVVGDGWRLYR